MHRCIKMESSELGHWLFRCRYQNRRGSGMGQLDMAGMAGGKSSKRQGHWCVATVEH